MHSVGSVRPRPTAANAIIRWWNNAGVNDEATELAETAPEAQDAAPQENQEPNEIEEDVVVIQEEEMVLVRKEQQDPASNAVEEAVAAQPVAEGPPQPQCIEPEPTVSAPAPSKSKPKKKQQKRK